MPLFASLVAQLFAGATLFLAKIWAARIALRVAAVLAITALGAGVMLLFNSTVAPLVAQLFTTDLGQLLGLAFPPVAGTCLAAIFVLWAACITYRLQVQVIKVTANI